MKGRSYDKKTRARALNLRRGGKTYLEINRLLRAEIPKGTLAYWFQRAHIQSPFTREKQLALLRKIQPLAAQARRQQRLDRLEHTSLSADEEVRTYPLGAKGFKKSLLAMLYWAEGAKHERVSGLKFTNTDPQLAHLYLELLRQCYTIDEARLRISLHLHYYHKVSETKRFWAELLKVPLSQFNATHIKTRSRQKRFRKNLSGICFIYYGDSHIREELLAIGRSLHAIVATR